VAFEWVDPTAENPEAADLGSVTAPLVVLADDRLSFRRALKDASIVLPATVRLVTHLAEFVLGPDVQLRASRLEITNAETVIVKGAFSLPGGGEAEEQLVVLDALSADVTCVNKVTCYGVLSVSWPGCRAYPWTPYATDLGQTVRNDAQLALVYRRFRRIAMAFRSHKKGQLARLKAKIDHARMLKGNLGRELLGQLLHDRVVGIDGKFYFWDRQVSDTRFGVSWQDLRRGFAPNKLLAYLHAFVEAHRHLFDPT
jgi:hypothetical protein